MSTITLWNVLNNDVPNSEIKRGVEIPMIQRDYAQGRRDGKANEIRKVFLNRIKSSIEDVINNSAKPLELDFIYGYLEAGYFVPLDGQQRLTTLYLLHWYFAFKERALTNLRGPFSRFIYQTRQSSGDFLRKLNSGLSEEDHSDIFEKNKSFEAVIQDKNWYYVSWKYDLTIQSAVCMLDEIHDVFRYSAVTLANLTDKEKPCVVFNYLDIKDFGLSDDLYIKMNARGKPLTNFENLKAELGKFIELSDFNHKYHYTLKHSTGSKSVDVETYFVTRIDTIWTDYFWKIRNPKTNEFDDKLLNMLAFVALNEVVKENVSTYESTIKSFEQGTSELSYYSFHSLGLLNEKSIISYIETLDVLVSEKAIIQQYLENERFLAKSSIIDASFGSVTRPTYEQRVIFYALLKFLISNRNTLEQDELSRWDRLIRNLVSNRNTIYNSAKDYRDSLVAIDNILSKYTGDIHETFLQNDITGFDSQQIKEEKLKLKLLTSSVDWHGLVEEAEVHPYLHGQIMFLLVFSGVYDRYLSGQLDWNKVEEETALKVSMEYFEKFKLTFKDSGLRQFENELFRRALLTKGDYLLYSTNWSLLVDNHRDVSWKRFLKETGNRNPTSDYFQKRWPYLKSLFDDLDANDIEGSLERIVKEHTCTDWRKDFIENAILLKLSGEKYLKFYDHDDDIFVLRKSKYNKYADPEVKSILLKHALLKKGFAEHELELGFVEGLNQYGIMGIRGRKPKIVFNHDGDRKFFVKYRGHEDQYFSSIRQVVDWVVETF